MNQCVYLYIPVCWAMDLVQHVWTPERCRNREMLQVCASECVQLHSIQIKTSICVTESACYVICFKQITNNNNNKNLILKKGILKYYLVKITSIWRSSSFLVDYFQVWMLVYVCAHDSGGRFPSSIIVCRCSDWKPDWLTNMSWLWPHAVLHLLSTILFEYLDYWHHTV